MKSKQKSRAQPAKVNPSAAPVAPQPAGRPEYEPTAQARAQVALMSGYGVPHFDIATALEISPPTLRKHFFRELEIGSIRANAKVAERLYTVATTGQGKEAITAMIFWLKARAGWRDQPPGGEQGKKEAQADAARGAGQGTEWGDDLAPPAGAALN